MEFIDVREDLGEQFPWDRIEFRFSIVGDQNVLISTKRVFDTGVTKTDGVRLENNPPNQTTFVGDAPQQPDVIRFRTIEDGNFHLGENTAPWAIIEETTIRPGDQLLTENGLVTNRSDITEITTRTVTYDSGNQTYFEFRNGTLRNKTIFDGEADFSNITPGVGQGSKSWFAVSQSFDENGALKTKGILFDNGIIQTDQFTNDVLTSRTLLDGLDSTDSGTKPWFTIVTEYDTGGDVVSKTTVYDDARRFEEIYNDGVLSQTTLWIPDISTFVGSDSLFFGTSRVTDFDETGQRTQQVTRYSDDDATGFIFTDGEITEKQFLDGDGDANWLVLRMILQDGQITSVTEYDDIDLVPDDIIVLPPPLPDVIAPPLPTFF